MAEKYYPISPYAFSANNPVRFVDPDGEDIHFFEVASYLNRNGLGGGPINNDMMRMIGGFEVSPYQNNDGDIIGWSAYRDGRIQFVMDSPGDIDLFTKNASTFGVAADFFYKNGTPTLGQIEMVAGDVGSGLLQQWGEALQDLKYYMYAANVFGAVAMMMPQGRQPKNSSAFHSQPNWGGFSTGNKTASFCFMPRVGVELFHHLRITLDYKLQEKANRHVGISLGVVFGGGRR